ncbi:MAG: peptidase M16 [Leptospiraceae bacterium]|nr:MAG: peptidase M16 [Leptospiraceae bacterium]
MVFLKKKPVIKSNLDLTVKDKIENEIFYETINNIRIGYIHKKSHLTFLQIANQVGSQIEKEDEWGICHILEHMFFKGSKKRPNSIEFLHSYNKIGASMNAYTDFDHTNYFISMLNHVFDEGFDIIADMYLNPLFPEKEFHKELNPILSELREKEDDPQEILYENSMKYFITNFHSILGTEESIKNTTIEKLFQFKNQYYGCNNTIITAVGGIEPDHFFKKVEEYFKNFSIAKEPEYPPISFTNGEKVFYKKGITESNVLILYPALPYNHKDRLKQNFLNYILGGMDSSLLFERIREELGLSCYEIYSNINRNQSFSVLEIFAGIATEEIDTLLQEIDNIIYYLKTELLNEERLLIAKNTLKTQMCMLAETSKGLSNLLLNTLLRKEFIDPIEYLLNEIDQITLEDIRNIADITFNETKFTGILLPENEN